MDDNDDYDGGFDNEVDEEPMDDDVQGEDRFKSECNSFLDLEPVEEGDGEQLQLIEVSFNCRSQNDQITKRTYSN